MDADLKSLMDRLLWRPMESAPRDGSMMLALNAAHGTMYVVGWQPASHDDSEDHWDDVGYRKAAPALYFNANYFQFWMPLPDPPSPAPVDREG